MNNTFGVINLTESFRTGVPVWAYYINIDTKANLMLPVLLRGRIGQHFAVEKKDIDSYKFIEADADLNGVFDENSHTVRLYYRRKDWVEVQEVSMFLKLNDDTTIFDTINGMSRNVTLPAGMTVKAFKRVATNNGKFWYEIGPEQWIEYHKITITKNPYADAKPTIEGNQIAIEPLNHVAARVDYIPNKKIQTYDKPYGKIKDELADDTSVDLIGKAVNNDGVVWYEIADKGFINGTYIKIKEQ
ncbi:hypothetical protein FD16_GL001553 [Paucilactobacillus suebicus DSM 5007 = KCTC 3549]|uniref:MucBP domain-containing protein n=1 Tax=Paucilactobacillus suebicus DSM 5007 = KCTC 3549 TaxID=1423807 RepID=A0A0R1W316_9LACO|nr:hypothetical protein FD16_GL001553 [Paucilactobacillus suebicus DSM 5007 = KCTC 3549]